MKSFQPGFLPAWIYWSLLGISSLVGLVLFLAVMGYAASQLNML
ncbi:MAG: hypothetical protein PHF75_05830 [Gallionella sp.]|nr:hypothetical protein [Gallionella sp.]MDD5612540.1 hypothetical protein [Gallionella sp.]